MIFKSKLTEFSLKFKVNEYWPNHFLLVELINGKVWLFDTSNNLKKQFNSMKNYNEFAYIHTECPVLILFTEISYTQQGRQIRTRYSSIKRIHLNKKS